MNIKSVPEFVRLGKFAALVLILVFSLESGVVHGINLRLRYQPEIDAVELAAYFKDENLYSSQKPCLLENERCNTIGRWLKRKPNTF